MRWGRVLGLQGARGGHRCYFQWEDVINVVDVRSKGERLVGEFIELSRRGLVQ